VASKYLVGEAGVDEEKGIIRVNLPIGLEQALCIGRIYRISLRAVFLVVQKSVRSSRNV